MALASYYCDKEKRQIARNQKARGPETGIQMQQNKQRVHPLVDEVDEDDPVISDYEWMETGYRTLLNTCRKLDPKLPDDEFVKLCLGCEVLLPDQLKNISMEEWEKFLDEKIQQCSGKGGGQSEKSNNYGQNQGKPTISFWMKAQKLIGFGQSNKTPPGDDGDDEKKKPPSSPNKAKSNCESDIPLIDENRILTSRLKANKKKEDIESKHSLGKAVSFFRKGATGQMLDFIEDLSGINDIGQIPANNLEQQDDPKQYLRYNLCTLMETCLLHKLRLFERAILVAIWTDHCTYPYKTELSIAEIEQHQIVRVALAAAQETNTQASVRSIVNDLAKRKIILSNPIGMYSLNP